MQPFDSISFKKTVIFLKRVFLKSNGVSWGLEIEQLIDLNNENLFKLSQLTNKFALFS